MNVKLENFVASQQKVYETRTAIVCLPRRHQICGIDLKKKLSTFSPCVILAADGNHLEERMQPCILMSSTCFSVAHCGSLLTLAICGSCDLVAHRVHEVWSTQPSAWSSTHFCHRLATVSCNRSSINWFISGHCIWPSISSYYVDLSASHDPLQSIGSRSNRLKNANAQIKMSSHRTNNREISHKYIYIYA